MFSSTKLQMTNIQAIKKAVFYKNAAVFSLGYINFNLQSITTKLHTMLR